MQQFLGPSNTWLHIGPKMVTIKLQGMTIQHFLAQQAIVSYTIVIDQSQMLNRYSKSEMNTNSFSNGFRDSEDRLRNRKFWGIIATPPCRKKKPFKKTDIWREAVIVLTLDVLGSIIGVKHNFSVFCVTWFPFTPLNLESEHWVFMFYVCVCYFLYIYLCIYIYNIYIYMYIYLIPANMHLNICDRRAETHERFYSIEVHRHRFARHARKVPFEKCEHWRKVCGRSAKDQIASTL